MARMRGPFTLFDLDLNKNKPIGFICLYCVKTLFFYICTIFKDSKQSLNKYM